MYSQNDEESRLLGYLDSHPETNHRFIDVGGYHPTVFSNTRCLVERNWAGTYVEPAPENFLSFLREYREREEIVLVNAAVDLKPNLVRLYDSNGDAVSTLDSGHAAKWKYGAGTKFRAFLTHTVTWEILLNGLGFPHNDPAVLSLDVEGTNLALFMAIPLSQLVNLKVLIVEHDGHVDQMSNHARAYGFEVLTMNGENLILVRS